MGQLFRIGEMAKLFGMNIRTLRYYDEAGLLHPVRVDPETNYRYYSVEQFEQLNTIRYLRTQGVGLEDIRAALAHRDPAGIRDLLRRQEEAVTRQLAALENAKARLAGRVKQIDDVMDTSLLDLLRFQDMDPRPIAVLDQPLRAGESLELPLRSLENTSGMAPSYFLGKVGLSIGREDLERGRFDRYRSLFCLLDPGRPPKGWEGPWPGASGPCGASGAPTPTPGDSTPGCWSCCGTVAWSPPGTGRNLPCWTSALPSGRRILSLNSRSPWLRGPAEGRPSPKLNKKERAILAKMPLTLHQVEGLGWVRLAVWTTPYPPVSSGSHDPGGMAFSRDRSLF